MGGRKESTKRNLILFALIVAFAISVIAICGSIRASATDGNYVKYGENNASQYCAAMNVTVKSSTNTTITYHWVAIIWRKGRAYQYGLKLTAGGKASGSCTHVDTSRPSNTTSWRNCKQISGDVTVTKTHSTQSITFTAKCTGATVGGYGGASGTSSVTVPITVPAKTKYTITYNANGGSGAPAAGTKWYGEAYTVSSTKPTRTGYTFKNWKITSTGNTVNAGGTISAGSNNNYTLNAQWTANKYTVHYNGNGATAGSTADSSHTYGTAKALTANGFDRSGYFFKGWAKTAARANAGTVDYADKASVTNLTSTNNGTVNLYAVWQSIGSMRANQWEGYTTEPKGSTSLGYNDGHLYINSSKNGGATWQTDILKVTPATTGTNASNALWNTRTGSSQNYSISKESGPGVVNPSAGQYASSKMNPKNVEADSSYIYVYYPLSVTVPRGYRLDKITAGYDKSVFSASAANWIYRDPTRNADNASWTGATGVNYGPFAEDTPIQGYHNFNITAAGLITRSANGTAYKTFQSLNLWFEPNETVLHYAANGGEGESEDETVEYDSEHPAEQSMFERDGYTFSHWNTKADGSGQSFNAGADLGTAFPAEQEVTLYAQWTPNNYVLKFNPLGGETTNTQVTVTQASSNNNTVDDVARDGYTFEGWYTSPFGGEQVYDEDGVASNFGDSGHWDSSGTSAKWAMPLQPNEEIQLYAHYRPDVDGGYVIVNNEKISPPPEGTKPSLKIRKIDASSGKELADVTFNLTNGGSYNESRTTDATGIVCWEELDDGTYTLTETSWPEGYKTMTNAEMRDGVHPYKVVVQDGKISMFAVSD